jgi:hypothetical protein
MAVRDENTTKEGTYFYFVVLPPSYSLEMAGREIHITKCHGIVSHA